MNSAGLPRYIEVNPKVAQFGAGPLAGAVYMRCRVVFIEAHYTRVLDETLRALKRAPRSKRAAIRARAMRRLNGFVTVRVE